MMEFDLRMMSRPADNEAQCVSAAREPTARWKKNESVKKSHSDQRSSFVGGPANNQLQAFYQIYFSID